MPLLLQPGVMKPDGELVDSVGSIHTLTTALLPTPEPPTSSTGLPAAKQLCNRLPYLRTVHQAKINSIILVSVWSDLIMKQRWFKHSDMAPGLMPFAQALASCSSSAVPGEGSSSLWAWAV